MRINNFVDNIKAISENVIDSRPSTNFGRVIRYYENTVTVETDDGVLENIKCVSVPKLGSPCILVPVGEEFVCVPSEMDEYTREEIDEIVEEIISGQIDLKDYVKKSDLIDNTKYDIDLNLSFGLSGVDDTISVDMDIVDHIVQKIINIGAD